MFTWVEIFCTRMHNTVVSHARWICLELGDYRFYFFEKPFYFRQWLALWRCSVGPQHLQLKGLETRKVEHSFCTGTGRYCFEFWLFLVLKSLDFFKLRMSFYRSSMCLCQKKLGIYNRLKQWFISSQPVCVMYIQFFS